MTTGPKYRRYNSPKYTPTALRTWLGKTPPVGLADGFPFLLISTASLAALNKRLAARGEAEMSMDRFRPNIVVDGVEPFEEDTWRTVRIGGVVFRVVKSCPRCKMTTVDPATGDMDKRLKAEPLNEFKSFRALAQRKKDKHEVFFGQNLVAEHVDGEVSIGDCVEVLETGPALGLMPHAKAVNGVFVR